MQTQLNYGNWIRKRMLYILGASVIGTGLMNLLPLGLVYRAVMMVLFVVLFVSFLFPLYAYIMFSQKGGRIQEKIYDLVT